MADLARLALLRRNAQLEALCEAGAALLDLDPDCFDHEVERLYRLVEMLESDEKEE